MNYHATVVSDRPQSEIDRISTNINEILERSSILSDQLGGIMDRLAGSTPPSDDKQSQTRAVRNGVLGKMAEQLEYLSSHISRIGAHIDRLDKIV